MQAPTKQGGGDNLAGGVARLLEQNRIGSSRN